MRKLKLLGKRLIFILSAILVAGGGILIYSYLHSKPVQAAWFDENWSDRQII